MANIFTKPRAGLARLGLYLVVFIGSALALNAWIFTGPGMDWSRTLDNPSWAAPGWVIGLVWTVQFALLALSAFLIDRTGHENRKDFARLGVITWWAVCMVWTWGYFGLRSLDNGLIITGLALIMGPGVLTLVARTSYLAALVLLPLQIWLIYAIILIWNVRALNA